MLLDRRTVLSLVASLFTALKRAVEKIADPFDTDEFRRNCPAPPGTSHRLHCHRRGSLPPKFECGIWTRTSEVSPQVRKLVELGLNDCDMVNWPREALSSKDQELARLWDPLPPPGYSAFELINNVKRPADVDPITFMIREVIRMTMEDRFYHVEYVNGKEVRHWLEADELTAYRVSVPTVTENQILAFLNVPNAPVVMQYLQRLYEIEYVRRFRPYETSFLVSQFRGGLKPIYYDSPAYVYMRTNCPLGLPTCPKRRKFPKATYSNVFEIEGNHPLNHVYVAFCNTPHHLYCLPAQVTLLEFALLLSALTPVGRQCVCDFYNKRGKIPAVLYWTWVTGATADGRKFRTNVVRNDLAYRVGKCMASEMRMCLLNIRDVHCRADFGANITLIGKLPLDEFSDAFEWVFPNLLKESQQVFYNLEWNPQGPTLLPGNITSCGILGPDYTSLVSYCGRYYYRVSRHGTTRDIPLTRYPSHADLSSEELQRAVDQAFAPTVNVAERTVEGSSPLSNPALSGVGSARE